LVALSTTEGAQAEAAQQILTDLHPAAFRVFAAPTGSEHARTVAERRQHATQGRA
jgi:hypothetical protein